MYMTSDAQKLIQKKSMFCSCTISFQVFVTLDFLDEGCIYEGQLDMKGKEGGKDNKHS